MKRLLIVWTLFALCLTAIAQGTWKDIESKHYVIKTDLPSGKVDRFKRGMDAIYSEYVKVFNLKDPPKTKAVIRIYWSKDDFMENAKKIGVTESAAAYYNPTTKELVGYYSSDEYYMFHCFFHEASHQFVYIAFPDIKVPTWFDEGMADCFGGSYWDKGSNFVAMYRHPDNKMLKNRLDIIKVVIDENKQIPLQKLINMTHEEFYDESEEKKQALKAYTEKLSVKSIAYAEAWSFCYFLYNTDGGAYRGILSKLFDGFKKKKELSDVYKDAFKNIELTKLENIYKAYIKKEGAKAK